MTNIFTRPLQAIDGVLNKVTMYKLTAWSLMLLLVAAIIFSATGVLSQSALDLAGSMVLLGVVCFASNLAFSKIFRVASNTESWLITALIIACIVPPVDSVDRALALVAVGVVAMAVKYLLVFRGAHFLNPAAFAVLVGSVTGIIPGTWWIGAPPMIALTAIVGFLILRKMRRFELFFVFAVAALVMAVVVGGLNGEPATTTLRNAVLSYPLVFLGTIMLTEPSTLPAGRRYMWAYGLLVGLLYSSGLRFGDVYASPHLALLVGNVFSAVATPKRNLQLRLTQRAELAPGIFNLTFEQPNGKRLPYVPGQYAEWTLPHKKEDIRGNRRTFSLASSPTEADLRVGIKTYQPSSSYKSALLALQPGDYIQVGHVGGSFTSPDKPGTKLLFIAGGIGITPFRSMVQYIIDTKQQVDIALIYVVNKPGEAVYQELFEQAAANGVRLHVVTGRLNAAKLGSLVSDATERQVYISGTNAMVNAAKQLLQDAGVSSKHIKTDYFSGY